MQRTNFTFGAATFSRFMRNTSLIKQTIKSNRKRILKAFRKQCAQMLFHPFGKAAAVAVFSAMLHLCAGAQGSARNCDVFANADGANPIRGHLSSGNVLFATNFVDIDSDGDLDCYVTNGWSNTPFLLENRGTTQHPLFIKKDDSGFGDDVNGYINYTSNVQFVDIDGDGDYDCFFSDEYYDHEDYYYGVPIVFFENIGTPKKPHFVTNKAKNPLGNATIYNFANFQFPDIDGDGDFDLYYYANGPYSTSPDYDVVVRNTGTKTNPAFTDTISKIQNAGKREARLYYDWNKDGLLDYFTVYRDGSVVYYQNTGTKATPQYTSAIAGPAFLNGAPFQIVDLNNDGAPEAFTASAHYSSVTPLAIIKDTTIIYNGTPLSGLSSVNTGDDYRYQWLLNGVPIPGARSSVIRGRKPGFYTLDISNACGTGESLPYRVMNDGLTVMQEKEAFSPVPSISRVTVQVYPNPFVSAVTVQSPDAAGTKSTVRITDAAGRMMLLQTMSSSSMQVGSRLSKGVYLLEVWQKDKVIFTTKLVKQ